MEPLIEKLISTGGPSGVLVVCVWFFLKHLREESELNRKHLHDESELNRQLFKDIHADHLVERKEARETIKENTSVLRELMAWKVGKIA